MGNGNSDNIVMYSDGGCHNTGDRKGSGSYAFLFKTDSRDYVDVYCEFIEGTTNNRTEMLAVIRGLEYAIEHDINKVEVVSDSGYLVKGYTDPAYLERWISNGWKTSSNRPVQNVDLWMKLMKTSWHIGFNFHHIRGHNKDSNKTHAFWNDICDRACTYTINECANPGLFMTLRYHFKTRKFEQISAKIIERSDDNEQILQM